MKTVWQTGVQFGKQKKVIFSWKHISESSTIHLVSEIVESFVAVDAAAAWISWMNCIKEISKQVETDSHTLNFLSE